MSLPRFFTPASLSPLDGQEGSTCVVSLPRQECHHLQVRRVKSGEHIVVADGDGLAFEVVFGRMIDEVSEQKEAGEIYGDELLEVEVVPVAPMPKQDLPNLALFQGVSKGERMDLTVKATTELGVTAIVPLLSSRCVVKFDDGKKAKSRLARWQRIAAEASKQSGRLAPPAIEDILNLEEAMSAARAYDLIIVAWEQTREGSLRNLIEHEKPASVALFIGPEGGFSPEEIEAMEQSGAHAVTLGNTILRTETAAIAGVTLVAYELGGLGNAPASEGFRGQ